MKNKEFNPKVQWAKFIVVLVLYLLFLGGRKPKNP